MSKEQLQKQKRLEQDRQIRRSILIKRLKKTLIWLIVLGVIVGLGYGWRSYSKKRETTLPGEKIPVMGREHIAPGSPRPNYNSNPPTSGPHFPTTAAWGVHEEIIDDGYLVHNLEHGGIWISYKNPEDQDLVAKLEALANQYQIKVVLTPRPENDAPVALAAWGRLLKLQAYDEAAIKKFIKAFVNKGPENVPF